MFDFLPKSFFYKNDNYKPLKSSIKTKTCKAKSLGYDGRDYQINCFKSFKNQQNTIFIAPTGSGKSLVQIFNAAREIIDSDYKKKQIFIVPQLNIGQGFSHHKHEKIKLGKDEYQWSIEEDCCENNKKSTQRIKNFLLKNINCDFERQNKILGGCTAIVSYAALLQAFNSMSDDEKKEAIKNVSFRLDEVHHISGVDTEVNPNMLGDFCRFVLENNGSLHLTTATFFRGDKQVIIGEEFIDRFKIYKVQFLEHFKNLKLKELAQDYYSFESPDNLIQQIINLCKKEPEEYPIIILPSDGQSFFCNCDKWEWTKKLVNELKNIFGQTKVLDLISEETQANDKNRLISENQDFSCVVTCAIGREGTDWPICSRVYNCVLDGNVLQPIQKLGRALRQFEGKKTVKMINFIEHFVDWDEQSVKTREKISDRFNAILFASMLDDMFYPKLMKLTTKVKKNNSKIEFVSLEDVYGDDRNEIIKELSIRVSCLEEKNSETIDQVIDEIIEEYGVPDGLNLEDLKDRLRYEVVIRHNNSPDLRMHGVDVGFIREQGWDKVFNKFVKNCNMFKGVVNSEDIESLDDLLKRWLIKSSDEKKKKLLEMARNGEDRPNKYKHPLGHALCHYTNPKSNYDKAFTKNLKELRPDWFVSKSDVVNEKKKQILDMAKNGEGRPNKYKHSLGTAISSYTLKSSGCYDKDFTKKLKELRPDWFITQFDISNKNKQRILQMAKNNEDKPMRNKHLLGKVLCHYTNSKSNCYDKAFTKNLKDLRPDWFVSKSDVVNEKKKQILDMAKNGEGRPNKYKHSLGTAISSYTLKSSGCYDKDFTKKLKELRPDWFVTQFDVSNEKKKQILDMAKNGEGRPNKYKHSLGYVLCHYTNPKNGSYDVEFDKQIRRIRPDWFKK